MSDGGQLVVAGVDLERRSVPASFLASLEHAWERSLFPLSPNTRRTYQSAWKQWCAQCQQLSIAPLPVHPRVLIGYLEQLSKKRAPNTVRLALAAIASMDQLARRTPTDEMPHSVAKTAAVVGWLRSWGRDNPRAPRKVAALMEPSQLRRVLEHARERAPGEPRYSHLPRYLRDRAVLVVGYATGCRVSELAALDVGDVEQTSRGLVITIRSSKTDQEGMGAKVPVLPQRSPLLCPVAAWQDWMQLRGELAGAAFLAVSRDGTVTEERLSVRALQRMFSERTKRAGLTGVSAHSVRRSMATMARERGARAEQVQKHGRWKRADSMGRYLSQRELFADNPTSGLLDDES